MENTMGILDSKPPSSPPAERKRQRQVLRGNIHALAQREGITYREAVDMFARRINRTVPTIYAWLTEGSKGEGGVRPMPENHYHILVDKGFLDESLRQAAPVRNL